MLDENDNIYVVNKTKEIQTKFMPQPLVKTYLFIIVALSSNYIWL